MTVYKITKIGEIKKSLDQGGKIVAASVAVNFRAPTKKGDDWSIYLGSIRVDLSRKVSFRITHLNSKAWGNDAWRSAPFDYNRPDVEWFVLKECAETVKELKKIVE